jgi:hypothetical protein
MLADEVTHVKMGSDWLRRVTENDPERRKKALEFQSVVDKIFSFGGTRSDSRSRPSASPVASASSPASPTPRWRRSPTSAEAALEERKAFSAASLRRRRHGTGETADRHRAARRRMSVTVTPEAFRFVQFDAALVTRVARGADRRAGHRSAGAHRDRRDHPARRVRATIGASPTAITRCSVESGAFEDSRRPREQSEAATACQPRAHPAASARPAAGRVRRGARRRRSELRQMAAWETYCAGRLARLGLHGEPAALALQLPQPPRVHRHRRRRLRPAVGRRRPHLGRARRHQHRNCSTAAPRSYVEDGGTMDNATVSVHQTHDEAVALHAEATGTSVGQSPINAYNASADGLAVSAANSGSRRPRHPRRQPRRRWPRRSWPPTPSKMRSQ